MKRKNSPRILQNNDLRKNLKHLVWRFGCRLSALHSVRFLAYPLAMILASKVYESDKLYRLDSSSSRDISFVPRMADIGASLRKRSYQCAVLYICRRSPWSIRLLCDHSVWHILLPFMVLNLRFVIVKIDKDVGLGGNKRSAQNNVQIFLKNHTLLTTSGITRDYDGILEACSPGVTFRIGFHKVRFCWLEMSSSRNFK